MDTEISALKAVEVNKFKNARYLLCGFFVLIYTEAFDLATVSAEAVAR